MLSIMTKMLQFIESITISNKTMLTICIYEDEKEKKEKLKICVAKITRCVKLKEEENKKRIMRRY